MWQSTNSLVNLRRLVILTACLLSSVLLLGGVMTLGTAFAQSTTLASGASKETAAKCSLATLNGRYVASFDGFLVMGSNRVPFAGAGFLIFDGHGHGHDGVLSQSVNGKIMSQIRFTGTYTVTPDCVVTLTNTTTTGVTSHFDLFTTPDGNRATFVQTDPGVVMSGVQTRGAG
ncbi:MAG TPA: hypothetical protein VFU49_21340 [Ktedonobacteraceae bacterium]|nr:hypothetical protein [Ktedonobacteraceae bacterium]